MATYVDTRTAADNECTYQGLIRCAVCNYIVSKGMWRLGEKVEARQCLKNRCIPPLIPESFAYM